MSSSWWSAWRSLISAERICPLAFVMLAMTLVIIAKPEVLKQLFQRSRDYLIRPQKSAPTSDVKHRAHPAEHSGRSKSSITPNTANISSNWLKMILKSVFLLALVFLSTFGFSIAKDAFCKDANGFPDLLEVGAEELIAGLESGDWTSVDLTKAYLHRIEETNSVLHAVTEINPDALSIAASLDAERSKGVIRSALHGIPMLIKNNDQMNNTAGSYSLLGTKVPRDATVAAKLREAGVIFLGKSNLSQWANFRSFNSSNGWSAYGGQVTGAYFPNQDPSGSSSGSGVGTSIGLAFAALGTETDGSIVSPSSMNNLVGIKPTVGLTSRSLVIPISEHQDTVGPMTRSVSDAAYVLSIIAGKDNNDNYTLAQPWNSPPDYTQALNFFSLRGARIGIPRNGLSESPSNPALFDAFNAAIQVMKNAGAIIVDNANFSAWEQNVADDDATLGNGTIVLDADFVSNLASYLSQLTSNPNNIKSLLDESNFTHHTALEQYPNRDTGVWDQALSLGYNNSDPRFWEAYQYSLFLGGEGGVLGALKTYNLDALILPSDFSPGLPARAGLPIVTVPMGFYPSNTTVVESQRGLISIGPNIPFGLSFMGAKWSEETLIGLAYAFEQRTRTRNKVKPYLVPDTQLADVVGRRKRRV